MNFYVFCTSLSIITISSLLTWYERWKFKKETEKVDPTECLFQPYFITHKNKLCNKHVATQKECAPYCTYRIVKKLKDIIDNANYTIKMCIHQLTMKDLTLALIRAHNRGVHIQIITDKIMSRCDASQIPFLEQHGIQIQILGGKNSNMHHKYFVVDDGYDNAILVVGSANYTSRGFTENYDLIVTTEDKFIIKRYIEEFNTLNSIAVISE